MAKKETLTRNGNQELCVNLHAPVGPKKEARVRNFPGDVTLIQGIFHVFAKRLGPDYIGLQSMAEVPTPNGQYDAKTENAIQRYQTKQGSDLLKADGVIDPGSYQNRNIVSFETSPLMTITLLHLQLRALLDDTDYVSDLTRLVPQLSPWLK